MRAAFFVDWGAAGPALRWTTLTGWRGSVAAPHPVGSDAGARHRPDQEGEGAPHARPGEGLGLLSYLRERGVFGIIVCINWRMSE